MQPLRDCMTEKRVTQQIKHRQEREEEFERQKAEAAIRIQDGRFGVIGGLIFL